MGDNREKRRQTFSQGQLVGCTMYDGDGNRMSR